MAMSMSCWLTDFYPRPPRGGRRPCNEGQGRWPRISIHALREEGDRPVRFRWGCSPQISIHALREEGDHIRWRRCSRRNISIHALREEGDHQTEKDLSAPRDFYPRPPRGGRHNYESCGTPNCRFLSTPSARRAT